MSTIFQNVLGNKRRNLGSSLTAGNNIELTKTKHTKLMREILSLVFTATSLFPDTLGEANDLLGNPKEWPFASVRAQDSSLAQPLIFIPFYRYCMFYLS